MKKLVIFDCDGVLINSEEMAAEGDCTFLAGYGLNFTVEGLLNFASGIVLEELLEKFDVLHRQVHNGQKLPADFGTKLLDHYKHYVFPKIRPIDGIVEVLEMLQREGIPFCVASNSGLQGLHEKLQATGLKKYFEGRIFSKDMVTNPKPAPDLFLFAADELGFTPDQCLVVEDSLTGANAIRAAKMQGIGFAGGSHRPAGYPQILQAAGVAETVQTMADMLPLMMRRLGLGPAATPQGQQPQAPSPF